MAVLFLFCNLNLSINPSSMKKLLPLFVLLALISVHVKAQCGFTLSSAQNNVSCNGGNNGSITITPSGGTPPYNYVWSPNVGNFATVSGLPAGTYTCYVT